MRVPRFISVLFHLVFVSSLVWEDFFVKLATKLTRLENFIKQLLERNQKMPKHTLISARLKIKFKIHIK
jgi:hypothetical protein